MKKPLIIPMMLAGILGVGAAAGINFGKDLASVHAAIGDAVSGWKANGTGAAVEGEDGIDITLSGYQSNVTKTDSKVYLDGLEFTMKNIGTAGGFYFSQDVNKTDWDGPVFTFWNGSSSTEWPGQARLFIQPNHNFNEASKTMAYKNIEDDEPSGLNDQQKSMVWSASETLTMSFKFELYEKDWFKITVSYPDASTVVSPNNANGKSFHTFVKKEAFSLDKDGAAYLKIHTAGTFSCTLKDFKNGKILNALPNTDGAWTKNAGGQTMTNTAAGVQFNNFGGYTATSRYTEKVTLDGLKFTIHGNGANNKENSVYGFYFNGEVEGQPEAINREPVFSIWEGMYGSQVRWQVGKTFDRDSEPRSYNSTDASSYGSITGVPAGVSTWHSDGENGYTVEFKRLNADWYEVTFHDTFEQFWYSQSGVVANNGDATAKTIKTYLKASQINGLDSEGKCYLYLFGAFMGEKGDSPTFCIENMVSNPTYVAPAGIEKDIEEGVSYVTNAFNELDKDDYKATAYAAISEAKATAIETIQAAEVVETIDAAIAAFDQAIVDNPKMTVTESKEWTVTNGSSEQLKIYETEENTRIKNLHAYSAEVVKNEKVVLDGFEMTFGSTGLTTSPALGFFFNQSNEKGRDGSFAVFSLWHALYSGQTRFHVGTSHDYNGASIAHASNSSESAVGFGVASNMVMNEKANDLVHVKFTHVSTLWWKVEISEGIAGTIWENNVNYESGKVTVYLQSTYLPIDENGAAYLHVEGFSNAGGAAIIKDMVNGELKPIIEDPATGEEITAAKAKLDEIPLTFPEECAGIATIISTAKEACDADNIKPSELETIVENAKTSVISEYRTWRGLNQEITEQDPTANYENYAGENIGKRLDDNGSVLMKMKTGYGGRGRLISKYSLTDFNMRLELIDCPINSAVPVTFSNSEGGNYASEDNYFHLEFYKLAADKYQVIFGNTKSHNVSIDDWTTSNVNTYTGRTMMTLSNIFDISMSTNFDTKKSILTINGESVEFDTRLIFDETGAGAGTDEMVTEGTMARITIGTMNNDGTYYNAACSISDAAYASYLTGRDAVVETALGNVAALEDALPETVTDENLDAFKATLESITGMSSVEGLTSYDFNKYVKSEVEALKSVAEGKLDAYKETVEDAKDVVYAMLDSYVEDDYYETEWAAVCDIVDGVDARLEALETVGAVEAEGALIKAELDAIKTKAIVDAETALANAKTAAVAELSTYADIDHIEDTSELRDVASLVSSGTTAINEATSIDEVAAKLAEAKGLIDSKKAEYAAKRALEAKQAELLGLIDELENSIDLSEYTEENAALIQSYIDTARGTIEEATSITGLQEVYDTMVANINAVAKVQPESEKPADKGCGGSVIAASAVITGLALAGVALIGAKRKED